MRISCLIFVVLLSSCQKYLDKKNDQTLAVPKRLVELQALLDDAVTMNYSKTPGMMDGSADAHFLPQNRLSTMIDYAKSAYIWNFSDYKGSDWAEAYNAVFTANYCLDRADEIPVTTEIEEAWKNVKGSGHFFRAYYFLGLAWQHAKLYDPATAANDHGIVLRLTSDFNVPSVRSSVEASYAQIIRDAHQALAYLPQPSLNIFRPSRAAANALLARIHLSMRNYDSAFIYSERTLAIKSDLLDYNTVDVNAIFPFLPENNPEMIFFSEQYRGNVASFTASRAVIDTTFYSSFQVADLRRQAFFRPSQGFQTFKGGYASGRFGLFSGLATDEIFLIRAECHARAGRTAEALADLNRLLRNRWNASFTPVTAANASEALRLVLEERKKELLLRGVRWIDIKRLNAEGAGIVLRRVLDGQTYELLPNDPRYAIKLPSDIIELTGMPQNQ